jgi:hypothetical protein
MYTRCYYEFENIFMNMKRRQKPYEIQQGEGGLFVPSNEEPIDSPNVQLRMPKSLYEKFIAAAGDKKAAWIRQAIREKLERDS